MSDDSDNSLDGTLIRRDMRYLIDSVQKYERVATLNVGRLAASIAVAAAVAVLSIQLLNSKSAWTTRMGVFLSIAAVVVSGVATLSAVGTVSRYGETERIAELLLTLRDGDLLPTKTQLRSLQRQTGPSP